MFKKVMTKLGRYRVINDRQTGDDYLERYYLFLKDRGKFPFNIFLHRFIKSDPDHLHDHPWNYTTIIISGGYYEWQPILSKDGEVTGSKKIWRRPGTIIRARADSMHRVELAPGIYPRTIFIPGKKKKDWGFVIPEGKGKKHKWVDHKTYLGDNV